MSISYSGITSYGKVTLPSVSGAFGTMNIIKDPPKSIHTRRKDRVGQNMDIVQMIQDSGSRSTESIREYARAVNPMVSVSYSNQGNNGGQSLFSTFSNKVAYTPNSLGAAGFQFRPPVRRPQELLPLSRQPRTNTNIFTNPEFIDFSKKLASPTANELKKEVLQETLKIRVRPNETFKIEKPIEEPFEVKYVIQNPSKISIDAGMRTRDIKDRMDVIVPKKVINDDILNAFATSNVYDNRTYLNESEFNTNKYIQDVLTTDVQLNKGRRIDNLPGEDKLYTDKYIQDVLTTDVQLNKGRRIDNLPGEDKLYTDKYIQDVITNDVQINRGRRIDNLPGEDKLYTDKYIQDVITNDVQINRGKRFDKLPGEDDDLDISFFIKDNVNHIDYTVPSLKNKKQEYIHNNPDLKRVLPMTSANAGITKNIHKVTVTSKEKELENRMPIASATSNIAYGNGYKDESSRKYYLPPTTNKGGFNNQGFIPNSGRIADPQYGDDYFISEKTKLFKKAASQFEGRYSVAPPQNF